MVVRNSINTFWYRWVSIPYLGIDTWYCHWNSDQKYQKKNLNEITGNGAETSKKPKKFEVWKSKYVEIGD